MKSLYTLIVLFLHISLFAQSVEGLIKDESNTPIISANILNISNETHTHSNELGFFNLKAVAIGDTLQFSHLTFKTKTIIVDQVGISIDIQLESRFVDLDVVTISPTISALNLITAIDVETNPVNSSQDILRQVPGLFIGQHAGGGKAEQIFLRGFDIDHGTDINITVDGLPVNMVSHAHGQGYADLHFVIPEIVNNIDFGKGPYYADQGNFNTAGYVNFETKDRLENSLIKLEAGQFNTQRFVSLLNLVNQEKQQAYLATEYLTSDGPFESPQNFNRINLMGKYNAQINQTDKIGLTASYFTSSWDASGQVPQRSIDNGSITRFGAIDDTEGGNTSRTNILLNFDKSINENSILKTTAYYVNYQFELFSNFTFFLNDPVNGDQIKQKENRNIFGTSIAYKHFFSGNTFNGSFEGGLSIRNDQSENNELSRTLNRAITLENIQLGDINETNIGIYLNSTFNFGKWTFNPSVRVDQFNFNYNNALAPTYQTQSNSKSIVSPKLNILYNYSNTLQFYLKTGKGFHSNDTRVVLEQTDKQILPAAYGLDFGYIWKPFQKVIINTAYWNLFLEQEFVYVGDEGVVEPSGKSQRQGFELNVRYQPLNWLYWNFDANYTIAKSINDAEGNNFIPLAPDFTLSSGLNIQTQNGIHGGVNVRHLKDRPANEDNSITATGYSIVDLNAGYKWKNIDFGFQIQNLFNTEWNETQFATESRLLDEIDPVEEIHFTPGTPFFIKGVIAYTF